jgi:hypothetical protein
METGLFEIQADHLNGFRQARQGQQPLERLFYALFGRAESASFDRDAAPANITNGIESFAGSAPKSVELAADPAAKLARCFLRLANLPNYALDRDGKRSGLFRAQPPRPSSTLLKAGLCHRLFTWP